MDDFEIRKARQAATATALDTLNGAIREKKTETEKEIKEVKDEAESKTQKQKELN